MLKVLELPSWYPRHSGDAYGSFIASQVLALKKLAEVRVVDCSGGWLKRWPRVRATLLAGKVLKSIKREGWIPDVIHVQVAYPAGEVGLMVGAALKRPVVLTEHTGPLDLLVQPLGGQERLRKNFSQYHGVIAVSRALAQEIARLGGRSDVEVIGNIVRDQFLNDPIRTDVPRGSFAFIGGFTHEKGLPELLDALKILADRSGSDQYEAHFLGSGNRSAIERMSGIKIHVWDAGQITVAELLNRVSFLVLPSRVETFSLVAAEAIALGRPVFGFDCGGPSDFVQGDAGVLLKERDPAQLADLIQEASTHSKWLLTQESCQARRKLIRDRFSSEQVARKLYDYLEKKREIASSELGAR